VHGQLSEIEFHTHLENAQWVGVHARECVKIDNHNGAVVGFVFARQTGHGKWSIEASLPIIDPVTASGSINMLFKIHELRVPEPLRHFHPNNKLTQMRVPQSLIPPIGSTLILTSERDECPETVAAKEIEQIGSSVSASKAEFDLETKLMCEKHTFKQLKELCREKNLLLGGTKSELASRLCIK
jgi:hypothetical protein